MLQSFAMVNHLFFPSQEAYVLDLRYFRHIEPQSTLALSAAIARIERMVCRDVAANIVAFFGPICAWLVPFSKKDIQQIAALDDEKPAFHLSFTGLAAQSVGSAAAHTSALLLRCCA